VAKSAKSLGCGPNAKTEGCFAMLSIGEVTTGVGILFGPDGGMEYVGLSFESKDFEHIKAAFVEKMATRRPAGHRFSKIEWGRRS
jgi:hypothetical protein